MEPIRKATGEGGQKTIQTAKNHIPEPAPNVKCCECDSDITGPGIPCAWDDGELCARCAEKSTIVENVPIGPATIVATETQARELPPIPFEFDSESLSLKIRTPELECDLDLASLTSPEGPLRFRGPHGKKAKPDELFRDNHGWHLRRAIGHAARRVFDERRRDRAALFGDHLPQFDVWELLKSGATLDWPLGAVIQPQAQRARTQATPIFELDPSDEEESGELIATRYLCRGGSLLITGPTGIGKSSLFMQAAIAWALGKPCLGFEPRQPIATLIVQAENDAGDLCEQRDGIVEGLNLTEQEQALLNAMLAVVTIDEQTGPAFFDELKRHIRDWQPDLIGIDPLNAFIGADINKQEVAADFLRHQLNPLLHRANVGAVIIHHTGKPRFERNGQQQELNPDYAGLGSSELANWARAICMLTVEGDGFALTLGKRGKRAGILDTFGMSRIWLRHAADRIFWEESEPPAQATSRKAKTAIDLLALVPLSPARVLKNSLLQQAQSAGFGRDKARTLLDELIDQSKVHVHLEKRPGTSARQYIARHRQEQQPEVL